MGDIKPISTSSSTKMSGDTLEQESYVKLPLVKINFILMAIAGAMIVIGFLLMLGGGSNTEAFNPDIFSARRIVVGPAISFIGFIFMGFGIIYRPKKIKESDR